MSIPLSYCLSALVILFVLVAIWFLSRAISYTPNLRHADLPSYSDLQMWIERNMPELDAELGPMGNNAIRIRLNEITGCNIKEWESISATACIFLAALKAQHEAKEPT